MSEFKGFPKETVDFFDRLKKNNTKQWFEVHRKDYDEYVKQPAMDFVVFMGEKLRQIAPGINAI
ncbi:MAG: DUF2461 family protein, partial [Deltaproteobacteria bacterium]|nr:DUF2461 family protein [Deltaproteobacteria bacterium]